MRNVILLLMGTTVVAACARAAPSFAYGMTGEMLVRKLSADNYAERELGVMYLSGVKDTTQGKAWCLQGTVKPDELDSELLAELKKLSSEKLLGNAAPLVVDLLRARFPCSTRRSRP